VAQLHSETAALLSPILEFGGHSYEFVGEEVEWETAEAAAVKKGGHLAIVNSPEENAFIASHIPNGFNWLWLGGTDRQQEGVWKWVDGTLMSSGYQNWGPNSPDNGAPDDGQDFLIMRLDDPRFSAGGKWDDTDYSAIPSPDYVIAYVIEYNKAP
jgi:hypothetical protein